MPTSPIQAQYNNFDIQWGKISREIYELVREYVTGGLSVDRAVDKAVQQTNAIARMEQIIVDNALLSIAKTGLEIIDKEKTTSFILHRVYEGDKMSLSRRIAKADWVKIIKADIKTQMKLGSTWVQTAVELGDKGLISGKLPKYITELTQLTTKQSLSTAQKQAARATIRKAERNIARLIDADASPARLKEAYTQILDAVTAGEAKALENAMKNATMRKARSNAERIARTEMSRAYASGMNQNMGTDDDVVGWKSILSSNHSPDICDFYAEADLYGLGAGCYPKSVDVMLPYHPNCRCFVGYIYRGDASATLDREAGAKWLKDNPDKRKTMMSQKNEERFLNKPTSWQRNLQNSNSFRESKKKVSGAE